MHAEQTIFLKSARMYLCRIAKTGWIVTSDEPLKCRSESQAKDYWQTSVPIFMCSLSSIDKTTKNRWKKTSVRLWCKPGHSLKEPTLAEWNLLDWEMLGDKRQSAGARARLITPTTPNDPKRSPISIKRHQYHVCLTIFFCHISFVGYIYFVFIRISLKFCVGKIRDSTILSMAKWCGGATFQLSLESTVLCVWKGEGG